MDLNPGSWRAACVARLAICTACWTSLRDNQTGTNPPKFAIANGLWIGRLPEQLRGLR